MELVKVGTKNIPVVPQRHARLRHLLSADDFQAIMTGDYARESYRILSILIPALPDAIPLWQWEGYGSQEAMDAKDYVEDADQGPTTAEIVDCFEKAIMVSGANRLGKIMDLVGAASTLTKTQTPTLTVPSPA